MTEEFKNSILIKDLLKRDFDGKCELKRIPGSYKIYCFKKR